MDFLNLKSIYDFVLNEYSVQYFAIMSKTKNEDGSMILNDFKSDIILYAHQYGGILNDDNLKSKVFKFLIELFKIRTDCIYCSLIKLIYCSDEYIEFNIRCKSILSSLISNTDSVVHFNVIIKSNNEYDFKIINSINE